MDLSTYSEPYRSTHLLPRKVKGWYFNQRPIDYLIRRHQIKTIVEVGCWLGASTLHMASLLPDDGRLFAVDHWQGSIENQHSPDLSTLFEQFLSNVIHDGLTHVIVPMRMTSLEGAAQLPVPSVDLVYLDASHDTESVLKDLRAWYPKVKHKGILCGDDWHWDSVRSAVRQFATLENLTIDSIENFWRVFPV